MHLALRAYVLLVITAVLAIAGLWSSDPVLAGAWRWPAFLLLAGLALEGLLIRRTPLTVRLESAVRAFLGRREQGAFLFRNEGSRELQLEYFPATPPGIEPLDSSRRIRIAARGATRDPVTLLPVRLGEQRWPELPARLLGRFGLAWWPRSLSPERTITVSPDTLHAARSRPTGNPAGSRPRRIVGAGSELHQLRGYVPGDPIARIDWKATARLGTLISREFTEDQHLDIVVAIDAGRLSRVRAGAIDRLGLYANIAARLAEVVTPNDDRIGLVVYSDRVHAVAPPTRGLTAVIRIRRTLERLAVLPAESDPVDAAVRIRTLLRHRGLVVLLTDLEDATISGQLARAVRLLSPPHLVVVAGVQSAEIASLARTPARSWRDPWIALAAQEHEARAHSHRLLLERLGAPVVAAREELLERAVFARYESLRRTRRV